MSGNTFHSYKKNNRTSSGNSHHQHNKNHGFQKHQQYSPSNSSAMTSQQKSLPCKKMICTGICTYRNRCHYIHDARIMAPASKGTCRKKNKDEHCEKKDLFFWPPMTTQPNREARNYSVAYSAAPASIGSDPTSGSNNGSGKGSGSEAVASLWHHFVEVCVKIANHTDLLEANPQKRDAALNPVTRRPRLSVFVKLAAGGGGYSPIPQHPPSPPQPQQQQHQQHQHQQQLQPVVQHDTIILPAPAPASPPCVLVVSRLDTTGSATAVVGSGVTGTAASVPPVSVVSVSSEGNKSLLYKYMPVIRDLTDSGRRGRKILTLQTEVASTMPEELKETQYQEQHLLSHSPTSVSSSLLLASYCL